MIDLMLDLETLGKGPGFAVLSAAIVPFHLNGKPVENAATFNHTISFGDSIALGMAVDPETLEWWMQNDPEVIRSQFKGELSVRDFCDALTEYLEEIETMHGNYRIWASAPKLDFGCLYFMFFKIGIPYPIFFSAERCMRTTREYAQNIQPGVDRQFKLPPPNHNAEADCIQQIQKLHVYNAAIRGTDAILAGKLKEDPLEQMIQELTPEAMASAKKIADAIAASKEE